MCLIRYAFSMTPIRWLSSRPSPRWKKKARLSQAQKLLRQLQENPNWLWNVARRKKKAKKRSNSLVNEKLPDFWSGSFCFFELVRNLDMLASSGYGKLMIEFKTHLES